MRFDEAVKKINENTCLYAQFKNGTLDVAVTPLPKAGITSLMLSVPKDAKSWDDDVAIYFANLAHFSPCFHNVSNEEFTYVLKVTDELLKTPINKRVKEKKYHLKWFKDDGGQQYYLAVDKCLRMLRPAEFWADFHWTTTTYAVKAVCDPDIEEATFTSVQLALMKRNHPEMAGAINAMTVEADDDE